MNQRVRRLRPAVVAALVLSAWAAPPRGLAQQPSAAVPPAPTYQAPGVQIAPGLQIAPALPGAPPAPGIAIPGVPGVTVMPQIPGLQQAPGTAAAPAPPGTQVYPGAPAPAAAAPPKPAMAEMSFVVGSNVNPDRTGRPSPVIVRTYELKSATVFNASDFFAIYERDKEILGADLVASDEWALAPGNNRQALKNLQRDTRYVGVIAAFRDVERAQWRAATFVYPNQTTRMEIRLERNEVKISLQ